MSHPLTQIRSGFRIASGTGPVRGDETNPVVDEYETDFYCSVGNPLLNRLDTNIDLEICRAVEEEL